jgi:hypothetical protein
MIAANMQATIENTTEPVVIQKREGNGRSLMMQEIKGTSSIITKLQSDVEPVTSEHPHHLRR